MKSKPIITALSAGVALSVATGCSRADTQGPTVNPPVPEEAAAGAAEAAQEEPEEKEAVEEEGAEDEAPQKEAAEELVRPARAEPPPINRNPPRGRPKDRKKSSE